MAITLSRTEPAGPGSAVRLTQQVKAGGCASKLPPGALSAVLASLPSQTRANLMVGFDTHDDAGVYRLHADQALVQTVDFFTPMVDEPRSYGRIAATNALSDIYAMGGKPITGLTLVCYPQHADLEVLKEIMLGGMEVMQEADCVVLGGHSVRDEEIKFGYAVTGLVEPSRVLTNAGAKPGDALVLAKAIGTGVITTALKQGRAREEWVAGAIDSMMLSNREAAAIVTQTRFHTHAVTDVTGFGLIGHAREMAFASGVRMMIETGNLPILDGALEVAAAGCIPGGLLSNRDYAECVTMDGEGLEIAEGLRLLLYDPQTSGGLLISLPHEESEALVAELRRAGYPAARIGSVQVGTPRILLQ